MKVQVNVSVGELLDKLTILEIKLRKIKDPVKWTNCQNEWRLLGDVLMEIEQKNLKDEDVNLYGTTINRLRVVNQDLWNIEDEIRDLERDGVPDEINEVLGGFMSGPTNVQVAKRFIELARLVYTTNDQRCKIKKELDVLFGSELTEEKSYKEIKS